MAKERKISSTQPAKLSKCLSRHGLPAKAQGYNYYLRIIGFVGLLFVNQPLFALSEPLSPAGQVKFFNMANTEFDRFTAHPNVARQDWMRRHYARMLVYAPYFDTRLDWYADGLVYVDSYAIYEHSVLAKEHPEWIMRDGKGRKLYIPWNCQRGRCDQFAGDFSNPAFKDYMIDKMRDILAKGYKGLWLDDVNLTWRVSNGKGQFVTPIDQNTGNAMTLADWQRYFADYMEAIRQAFPNIEIAHNAIWHADTTAIENPAITRQIKAADYINLERGGSDLGLISGDGPFGFQTFLRYIDYVHNLGSNVILMDYGITTQQRHYGLATWFLVSQGHDLMSSNKLVWSAPTSWWPGYSLHLGEAIGPRYQWHGLLRRDFSCGMVLLNQSKTPVRNIQLDEAFILSDGKSVSKVKLGKKSALILQKTCLQHSN
ncbi:MAG: putative glycoside hydrolase [Methylococcales bacterium]